ncbi:MAG TPA: DUF4340 domain-containing protein [Polyangia bacterium]|jgi:hypothetical protein
MNRKTLTALALLGILAVVAFVVLRQPEKGQIVGERPRPIPKLTAGAYDTLTVTKGTSTTTIKRDGDKYKIVAPENFTADEAVAKQAFEAIDKLEFGNVVSDQKAKQAEFEVDDKALKVAIKKGDQVVAELLVGKSVGGNTLVRIPGKDEIWQGLGSFRFNLDRDTAGWRDKTITKFNPADVEKIELKSRDGGHAVLKKESGDKWSVVESSVKVDKLDSTVPAGIVSTLATWVTNDFAGALTPTTTGLDSPANTITVSLKGGKPVSVLIGNKKGADDTYVKTADAAQIYLVKRYNVDRVDKHPIDLRDKTVCDISDVDLGQVEVTHDKDSYTMAKGPAKGDKTGGKKAGKDEWHATKPKDLTIDPAKVSTIASAFKDWKATGFAADQSPKANGLAKPKAVIVATSKDKKKSCTLKIGDETADKVNYNAAVGSDVFLLPKWSADRILTKIDDIKKK